MLSFKAENRPQVIIPHVKSQLQTLGLYNIVKELFG